MTQRLMTNRELATIKTKVLLRDFEKIDSVMAGREVKIVDSKAVENSKQPPAWSRVISSGLSGVSHEVTFSSENRAFDVTSVEGVVGITGLNYHELAHVLYTQGASTPNVRPALLPSTMLRNKVYGLGNPTMEMVRAVLEDQRIERKFLAAYSPTKPYFQSVVGRFLLDTDNKDVRNTQYLLIAARTYVDKSIRVAYRNLFIDMTDAKGDDGAAVAKAYSILANKFADLDMATDEDVDTAMDIIRKAVTLLTKEDLSNASKDSPFHGGTSNCDPSNSTGGEGSQDKATFIPPDPATKSDQRKEEAERVLGEGEYEGEPEDEGASGSGDESDEESGDGKEDGSGSSQDGTNDDTDGGSGESEGGDASDDQSSKGNRGEGESSTSAGAGTPGGLGKGEEQDGDVEDDVKSMVADAENSDVVQEEYNAKQRSLRNLDRPGQTLTIPKRKAVDQESYVTPEMNLIAKRIASEFRQLRVDLDPGRKPYQPSGVVSMKRAMKGVDYDTVFDSWDEGQQDATDMEVVILADLSASMAGNRHEFSMALWCIQRAIQMSTATSVVSVIGYGVSSGYLDGRGAKVSPTMYPVYRCSDGGTNPRKAIVEALALFATTKRPKKVLITLTDGVWDETLFCESLIERMNGGGVTTSLFMFSKGMVTHPLFRNGTVADRVKELGHGSSIYHESSNIEDLIGFAKQVVTTAMKEH